MRLLPVCLVLALLTALPWPAQAAFGDCTTAGYLDDFPDAPTAAGLDCVELFRFGFSTPDGPREMRAIADFSAGWAVPPSLVAGVERGARAAAAAFAPLGSFSIDDVTLLLLDDVHGFGDSPEILAMTDGRRGTPGARRGECMVTVYGLSAGSSTDEIAITTAHEIFHCLQYASLSNAQMATYGSGGDWWIEGSAEYFSAYAVSGSAALTDRGSSFDAAVDAGTALDRMAHEASVFFFWWAEGRGPGQLMTLLRAMADSGGASAQHGAMRAVLGDELWLDFATSYADAEISHPQGGGIGLSPSMRETRTISRDTTERLELEPFTLLLGTFDYDCGTWGHTLDPANPNLAARIGEDPWGDWPEEMDARDGGPATIRFVGMHTGDSAERVANEIERRRSCEPCAGTDAVDACVAGIWQMTSGGPVEWMRAQGLPITRHAEGPRYVTFLSDGGYATPPLGLEIELREGEDVGEAVGMASAAFGRWSAEDGTLNICQDAGGVTGTVTVTTRSGSTSGPVSQPGAGTISMRYSCSEGGSMDTYMTIPGMSEMQTGYTRLAPEPGASGE